MGARWESVVLNREGVEYSAIAGVASSLISMLESPRDVRLHLMASKNDPGLVSSELAAFREKPVRVRQGVLGELEERIFARSGHSFENAEILFAREASHLVARGTLYVYANEAYNAAGYVRFTKGSVTAFEIAGWHGSDSYFSDGSRAHEPGLRRDMGVIVSRGLKAAFGLDVRFLDDLFEQFYGYEGAIRSYHLVRKGEVLAPPEMLQQRE